MRKAITKGICLIMAIVLLVLALMGNKTVYATTNGVNVAAFKDFTSTSYILMEAGSGKPLVTFNENERMPVASICKLMTSLLTLEALDRGEITLDTMFVASKHAAAVEGSQAFLDAGSQYSVADLLKSVIVASANDSAIVLAEGLSGSEEVFVTRMNERAKALGMTNTNYTNATGLTTKDQYSTAYDTCLILRETNKHELYGEYARIWMDSLTHPSGRETELVNTNRLIKYYPYCVDGKTGYTDEAGYCLSSVAEKDGLKLVAVALNCDNAGARFYESMKMYDYGFANYSIKTVLSATDFVAEIDTNRASIDIARVGITNDIVYLYDKQSEDVYDLRYDMPEVIGAGHMAGDVIGSIQLVVGDEVVSRADVVLLEDVIGHKMNDVFEKIFQGWRLGAK